MSDDRLDRLLELADGPRAFPDDEKRALRAAMIATATRPSTGADTVVPLQTRRAAGSRRTRPWVFGVAAASVAVLVVAIMAIGRFDPIDRVDPAATPPTAPTTPSPTPDELCAEIRAIGTANGLIGPGSPVDAVALDAMAVAIDGIARTVGDTDVADLASRVRLLAGAVREGQGGAVINTVTAIGDDVERLFEGAGPCSSE